MRFLLLTMLTSMWCISFSALADDLHTLLVKTLNSHPNIQVEQSRLDVASTQLELANEQFYPTFSVNFENVAKSRDVDNSFGNQQAVATFRLQQPLYTFGRLTASKDKFMAGVDSQAHTIEEVKLQLAQSLLQAWGDWYVATLRQQAIAESLETHKALKDSVSRRAKLGASSPSEVQLSVARLAQFEAQAINAQLQERAARVSLAQLVGETLSPNAQPKQFLSYVLGDDAQMVEQAIARHPVLARLAAEIRRSEAERQEEIRGMGPEIYLRAEHQRGDFSTDIAFQNRVFIGFQSDFGAGNSALVEVKLVEQQIKTLRAEITAAKRDINERVMLEITQLNLLDQRQQALEMSLSANQDIAAAFNRQYLAGRRSWVEVMNTARELSQAKLELADLKAAKVLSYWRLSFLVNGIDGTLAASQSNAMK